MPRRPYLRTAPRTEIGTASTVPNSNLLETGDPLYFSIGDRLLSFIFTVSQRLESRRKEKDEIFSFAASRDCAEKGRYRKQEPSTYEMNSGCARIAVWCQGPCFTVLNERGIGTSTSQAF